MNGWDRQALRDRLARAASHPGLFPGDQALGPGPVDPDMVRRSAWRSAAVLVPLIERPDGLTMLLTRRTEALKRHAGQVAFPGGRVDPEDADPVAAALREAEEEVGLARTLVEVVGVLPPYGTATGFMVTPVVSLVAADFTPRPDPNEVADVFEVPLDVVLNPANHQEREGQWRGHTRRYFAIEHGPHRIWGATAAMIVNFSQILHAEA